MSSNMSFKGALKRALKGDLDAANIFGLNPSRGAIKANKARREVLAGQIDFEKNNEDLKAAGGSVDAPTVQIRKLKSRTRVSRRGLLTGIPEIAVAKTVSSGGGKKSAGLASVAVRAREQKKKRAGKAAPARLSERQLRVSILGALRTPQAPT